MRSIIFDTGPIISLVTNNLLWILEPLKNKYQGNFYITPAVKKELIDKALKTKKFEFEALQISQLINKGILEIINDSRIRKLSKKLLSLANNSVQARGNWMNIASLAEIEVLAANVVLEADAAVIDERTIRMLLENSRNLSGLMEKRFRCNIVPNKPNIREFKKLLENAHIIRSTELVIVAYNLGILDSYIIKSDLIRNPQKRLLDALLWGLKLRGCSISSKEIQKIIALEG